MRDFAYSPYETYWCFADLLTICVCFAYSFFAFLPEAVSYLCKFGISRVYSISFNEFYFVENISNLMSYRCNAG